MGFHISRLAMAAVFVGAFAGSALAQNSGVNLTVAIEGGGNSAKRPLAGLRAVISNTGTENTTQSVPVFMDFTLSPLDNSADILVSVDLKALKPIKAGKRRTVTIKTPKPHNNVQLKSAIVGVTVDRFNVIGESNETDNFALAIRPEMK